MMAQFLEPSMLLAWLRKIKFKKPSDRITWEELMNEKIIRKNIAANVPLNES